ncbi:MAG: cell division protein SepF [Acidimicrobiales bacterium]|nr:cell division protein SepF [Acidimicrobiales bacterium]
MAVFRNVMAFLGLDDDDQVYDDEASYEDYEAEEEPVRRSSGRGGSDKQTISLEDRFSADAGQPTFGFSAEPDLGEVGGVGAVRPLRPVPTQAPVEVPAALSPTNNGPAGHVDPGVAPAADRRTSPSSPGAFATGQSAGSGRSHAVAPSEQAGDRPTDSTNPSLASVQTAPSSEPAVPRSDGGRASSPPSRSSLRQVEEQESNVVTHAKPRLHIPSSFDDASRIADDFRAGSPVVMNLTRVDKPIARRLVDFASGVCYVLAGGMERVAPNVYLLTPSGVDVSDEDRRRMQERGFDR